MRCDLHRSLVVLGIVAGSGCGLVLDLDARAAGDIDGGVRTDGASEMPDALAAIDALSIDGAADAALRDGAPTDAASTRSCDLPGLIACFEHECGADLSCEYEWLVGAVAVGAEGSGMDGTRHSLVAQFGVHATASTFEDVLASGTVHVRLWVDVSSLVLAPSEKVAVLAVHSVEGGWFEVQIRDGGARVAALVTDDDLVQTGPSLELPPGPQLIEAWFTPASGAATFDGTVDLAAGGMRMGQGAIQSHSRLRRIRQVFVGTTRPAVASESTGEVRIDQIAVAVSP